MAARLIFHALRIAAGALFVGAGAVKIWDLDAWQESGRWAWATPQFALDVQNFQLTSWTVAIVVATYLPWLEVLAGTALIARRLMLGALTALAGMMGVFMVALGSAWWRGLDISCGCFGHDADAPATDPLALLVRDAVILAVLAALLWHEARQAEQTDASPPGDALS